jgi:hypothetical protein
MILADALRKLIASKAALLPAQTSADLSGPNVAMFSVPPTSGIGLNLVQE